jgi:hypothetical protein
MADRRSPLCLLLLFLVACRPTREIVLTGFSPSGPFGEQVQVLHPDSGVTATIVAPAHIDASQRLDLILYALPNGNTTAQTMGRALT